MHTRAIGGRYLTGNFAPIWTESDAHWLPVTGELPKGLEGTLFRNGPNPQFWPTSPHHHWFGGDGMIHAFTIEKKCVRYRNRWVAHAEMAGGERRGASAVRSIWAARPECRRFRFLIALRIRT